MTTKKVPNNYDFFCCNICDYSTSRKSQYNRHLLTSKHKNNEKYNILELKSSDISNIVSKFSCECGKVYPYRGSLYNHKKKCEFINEVSKKLNLSRLSIINDRAEIIAHDNEFREKFDLVVTRAVGNLSELSEISIPFVKIGGISMALKGKNIQDEINLSKNASNTMGGAPPSVVKIKLPAYSIDDSVVYWMKINKTPKIFPRSVGIPHKSPII